MANALIKSLIIDDYLSQVKDATEHSLEQHKHRHDNDGRLETAVPKPDTTTNTGADTDITTVNNTVDTTDASASEPVVSAERRAKVIISTPMIDDNPAFVYRIIDIDNGDILTRTTIVNNNDHISAETDQGITHNYMSNEFSIHEITIDDSIEAHPLFKPWINLLAHELGYNVPLDDRYELIDEVMEQFLHFIGNLHQKTEWQMEQVITFVEAYNNIYDMMVMAYADINDDQPYYALQYLDENIYTMLRVCDTLQPILDMFWPADTPQPDFDTLMARAYHADDLDNHEPNMNAVSDKLVTVAFAIACVYAYEGHWRDTYRIQATYTKVMSELDPDTYEKTIDWYSAITSVYKHIHAIITDAELTFDPAKHGAWLCRMTAHDDISMYTVQLDWVQYIMSNWMNTALNHMSIDNLDLDTAFNNKMSIVIDDQLHDVINNHLHYVDLTPRYIDDDLDALSHASGITMTEMVLLEGCNGDDDETIGGQLNVSINKLCVNPVIMEAKTQLGPQQTVNTLRFKF